jgi:hypothetical protein
MSQHLPAGTDKTLETISGWLVTCQHTNKVPHEYTCSHYSNLHAPTTLSLSHKYNTIQYYDFCAAGTGVDSNDSRFFPEGPTFLS